MLSTEKTKSAEINHRAWQDKKANLTLLTEATKFHQAELSEATKSHQEELRNERRRLTAEISDREKKLSAERLLRTYLQEKYEKNGKRK